MLCSVILSGERLCDNLFGWTSRAENYVYLFHFHLGFFETYTPFVPVSCKLSILFGPLFMDMVFRLSCE